MPLQLNDIELTNGALAPQFLDIESYFVRFSNGTGQFPDSTLTANFIMKKAPTANGEVLSTVSAGTVTLSDDQVKGFQYYPELFAYLGGQLYNNWLIQNSGYSVKQ